MRREIVWVAVVLIATALFGIVVHEPRVQEMAHRSAGRLVFDGMAVDGNSLGQSRETVRGDTGLEDRLWALYLGHPTQFCFEAGRVVGVHGRTLSQDGIALLVVGDPSEKIRRVLGTPDFYDCPLKSYEDGQVILVVHVSMEDQSVKGLTLKTHGHGAGDDDDPCKYHNAFGAPLTPRSAGPPAARRSSPAPRVP